MMSELWSVFFKLMSSVKSCSRVCLAVGPTFGRLSNTLDVGDDGNGNSGACGNELCVGVCVRVESPLCISLRCVPRVSFFKK